MCVCGFSGFSTVESPRTAGVTDNPRPPPLSGEPPIGLGAGGKNPGPGGHPGGPLTRRRGPVARGGTRREVLRFRLPYGTPLARHAPPSPTISCSCDVGGQRAVGSPLVSEESAVRAVTKAAAHRGFGRARVYLTGPKPPAPHGPTSTRSRRPHPRSVCRHLRWYHLKCHRASSATEQSRVYHCGMG